jgi:hypothetical protein
MVLASIAITALAGGITVLTHNLLPLATAVLAGVALGFFAIAQAMADKQLTNVVKATMLLPVMLFLFAIGVGAGTEDGAPIFGWIFVAAGVAAIVAMFVPGGTKSPERR